MADADSNSRSISWPTEARFDSGVPVDTLNGSVAKRTAYTFNTAAIMPGSTPRRRRYVDGGQRPRFTLRDGRAYMETPHGRTLIKPHASSIPQALTYTRNREGDVLEAPRFDLIAASGARILAKQAGVARFFFTTVADEFYHTEPRSNDPFPFDTNDVGVPGIYTTLDPTMFRINRPLKWARLSDHNQHPSIVPHVIPDIDPKVADDIAIEVGSKLPGWLVRPGVTRELDEILAMVGDKPVGRGWQWVVAAVIKGGPGIRKRVLRSIAAAVSAEGGQSLPGTLKKYGIAPHVLQVLVKENYWYAVDGRPPFDTKKAIEEPPDFVDPPKFLDQEPAVFYQNLDQPDSEPIPMMKIRILGVVDVGVGHLHRHIHYDEAVGGEFDTTDALGQYWYPTFMGPADDGGGYIDGTCNFYILARIGVTLDGVRQESYGILWADEQSYATDRFHLLHHSDAYWHLGKDWSLIGQEDSPLKKLLLNRASPLRDLFMSDSLLKAFFDKGFEPPIFEQGTFWCPFEGTWHGNVCVDDRSRMVVARQVIMVTGWEPGGVPAIYSINASFGTLDRSWRWRPCPPGLKVSGGEDWPLNGTSPDLPDDAFYPETLRLREDLTAVIKGTRGGVPGYWIQRYLPADNIEVPSQIAPVASGRPRRPTQYYRHPWRFLPMEVFRKADKFHVLGVYRPVDSRSQYYEVDVLALDGHAFGVDDEIRWVDKANRTQVIELGRTPHGVLVRRRRKSAFNTDHAFHLRDRGPFGLVMTWWDKRDDEILDIEIRPGEAAPPTTFTLTTENGATAKLSLGPRRRRWSPPVVQMVHLTLQRDTKRLTIRYYSRFAGPARRKGTSSQKWWRGLFEDQTRAKRIDFSKLLPPNGAPVSPDPFAIPLSNFHSYLGDRYETAFPGDVVDDVPDAWVWRLHVAALGADGAMQTLLGIMVYDVVAQEFLFARRDQFLFGRVLQLDDTTFDLIEPYLTPEGITRHCTSVWFEDIVGHETTPEHVEIDVQS